MRHHCLCGFYGVQIGLFNCFFRFWLGFGGKFWLKFGQQFWLNTFMKSTHRFFHDRSETDANKLALIVVSFIDQWVVLADEKGLFSRFVQKNAHILLNPIYTAWGNHFGSPKEIFTKLGRWYFKVVNFFGWETLSDVCQRLVSQIHKAINTTCILIILFWLLMDQYFEHIVWFTTKEYLFISRTVQAFWT